jgi:hypothetical protein
MGEASEEEARADDIIDDLLGGSPLRRDDLVEKVAYTVEAYVLRRTADDLDDLVEVMEKKEKASRRFKSHEFEGFDKADEAAVFVLDGLPTERGDRAASLASLGRHWKFHGQTQGQHQAILLLRGYAKRLREIADRYEERAAAKEV